MTAWLAQAGGRTGGYGLLTDIALGVAGARTVAIAAQRRLWAHLDRYATGRRPS